MYHIKLTDAANQTHGRTRWGPGVRHEAASGPTRLCSDTAIHFYSGSTLQEALALAVHMNPAHANFRNPRAWVFEPEGEVVSDGTKSGCNTGTTVAEVNLPDVTSEQRVEVAIRCVLELCPHESWVVWAEKWLSGEDRSRSAADDAAARAVAGREWAAAEAAEAVEAADDASAALAAAHSIGVGINKIAASVYYREEPAQ